MDNGLSAFPITSDQGANGFAESGLTKREWFAGMALQGLLAQSPSARPANEFANEAWTMADAMLANSTQEEPTHDQ